MKSQRSPYPILWTAVLAFAAAALLAAGGAPLAAQLFDSGSTGADGALVLTTPGTVVFDPASFSPPLDPDGDNVYHFTSITIGAGVTVRLLGPQLNMGSVYWLATGPVQIDGVLDLNGGNGHIGSILAADRQPSVPGPGGYPGGVGGTPSAGQQGGSGPGGGGTCGHGGGAGHSGPGCGGCGQGLAYGNPFLVPLLGGSGGAGGSSDGRFGSGGGAGGGAILIASSTSIAVNGSLTANGGNALSPLNAGWGGGGSGGAIHLLAPTLAGSGAVRADGGLSAINCGAAGRIRFEAFQHLLSGTVSPGPVRATPFTRSLTAAIPRLRVLSVAGAPVPPNPDGSFTVPDVTINQGAAVPVEIEARNVPPGTVVQLFLYSETGSDQTVNSGPLSGTLELSTATASVVFPPGFTRGFVRARWTP